MKRFIITADVHGSLSTWLTILALLKPEDTLVVAGDLFDTRYGNWSNPDFAPEEIRSRIKVLPTPFYYVYGNCDTPSFFPGYHDQLKLDLLGRSVFLHHGHKHIPIGLCADIIIQGHTHLCHLEKKEDVVYLNPGSVTRPKNSYPTYAVMDKEAIALIELKTGTPVAQIRL